MESAIPAAVSLREHFEQGMDTYNDLEEGTIKTTEPRYADTVNKGVRAFMTAQLLATQSDLFSSNETLEDIKTSSLKYLALPFYLGSLYQKVPNFRDYPKRLKTLKQALKCYRDFLQNCVKYTLVKPQFIAMITREEAPDHETNRSDKIARRLTDRYRREKDIKEKLAALFRLKLDKGPSIDMDDMEEEDEDERDLRILLLEQNCLKAIDSVKTLQEEIDILKHMTGLMAENDGKLPERHPEPPKGKAPPPLVIRNLRQEVKDNAFKPGWNLPTVSIEEANYVDAMEAMERHKKEKAKEAQEKYVEEWGDTDLDKEDPDQVYKDREMDAFKDDNPKGSGNTGTKGYAY